VTFLETVLEKEGVVVKELTSQGKNAILNGEHRESQQAENRTWYFSCWAFDWGSDCV